MANYTITRHVESGHAYGCTNFSTTQEEGQVASTISGAPLDATIVWDLKANTGYSVAIEDFAFTNGTSIGPTPLDMTAWKDLPAPILGATMEQISSILIRITLYLTSPTIGILTFNSGSNFVMPNSDVDVAVAIEGCAKTAGEGVHLRLVAPQDPNTAVAVLVNKDLERNIVSNYVSDELDEVQGILPPLSLDVAGDGSSAFLMSYLVSAGDGYRYTSAPMLVFSDERYSVKTVATRTQNPYSKDKPKNITSVRFDIYKKN